jgi:hybrid cluster-associated redox disulfide protein
MEDKDMAITKDMIIAEVLSQHEELVPVFINSGLHCLGCAMAHGESIEGACMVHGLDCDELVNALNTALGEEA